MATRQASEERTLRQFGLEVRAARVSLGLSQEQLAELANFDRTYVSLVERGQRNLSLLNICRLARALRTTPAALIGGL